MVSAPTLETARLRLRPYRPEDFEAFAALFADPLVTRHIAAAPLRREEAWDGFLRRFGLWAALGYGFFAIEEKATGRLVGEGGFQERRRAIAPSLEGLLEAGWLLAADAQGRGYAREAMGAALDWARERFPQTGIACIVAPDNAASLRLAARLGFRESARVDWNGRPTLRLDLPFRGKS